MRTGAALKMERPNAAAMPDPGPVGSTHLVGRSDLVARSLVHVSRAREGVGGVLAVRGEAGVGKSCVIGELTRFARAEGLAVLYARAEEFEEGIPYAAYRAAFGGRDASAVVPAARAAQLVNLMSGNVLRENGTEGVNRLSRVHAETLNLLQTAATTSPLVLVVEDLHVADPDSVTLTRVLARSAASSGFLLVTSLRPDVSAIARTVDAAFGRMAETGDAEIMDVPRLDDTAVAALAEVLVGAAPEAALVRYIVEQTQGIPFFVKELILGLQQADGLVTDNGVCRLVSDRPRQIGRRTAILHRVFSGARPGRDVAKAVAVLGRVHPARLGLVADLSGAGQSEGERAFDGLVRDAILRPLPDGGYEFTHPLVRAALYDDIGPAERCRLHAAAARWLLASGDSRDRLEATAHVAESATSGDTGAVELLIGSADATAAVAPMNAAAWYARALEIMDPEDQAGFQVRSRWARALWMAGHPVEAGEQGRLALNGLPTGERARTAVLTVNALYAAGTAAGALEVCDQVVEPSGDEASEDYLTLRAQRLHIASQVGIDPTRPEPLPPRPALIAKPGVVRLTHLLLQADLVGDVDRRREVLTIARETLPMLTLGPRLALLEAMAMVHADAGELTDASAMMHEARRLAEGTAATNLGGQFAAARVRLHRLTGDWDAALEAAESATHDLSEAHQLGNLCIVQALTGLMLADRGKFDEAERIIRTSVPPVPSFEHLLGVARARRLRISGDPEGSIAAATGAESTARRHGWEQWRYLLVQELVEAHIALDQPSEAARLVATLDRSDERPLHRVVCGRLEAAVAADGAAALASGKLAQRHGLVVEAAVSAVVAARLKASDVDLEDALAVFESIGADPWAFQTRKLMRESGQVPPHVSGSEPGSLTATERKMALLVQQGLTNREIAGALHYSPKTVEVYLSRVYAKCGVASRLALARAMDSGAI
ncbi:AAA family ATPase [Streptomyces sp. NPDC008343]|uniref:helix-turn-helix transcriptional regulator n=1 Tax=Streptomyces sp. NPDC008343 TaxID=3364828 RepID=UPI0036E4A5E0